MHLKSYFMISAMALCFSAFGQEIKTKVTEEGFTLKPDPTKEEQFDEARFFVYLGGGYGIRTGKIITGFLVSNLQNSPTYSRSTTYDSPLRNGFVIDFGGRYFFEKNFGVGLKSTFFLNSSDFKQGENDASQSTMISHGMIEGLYRIYFSKSLKQGFAYGGIGIGAGYIDQTQKYRYSLTNVNETFFAVRPMIGLNMPIWDIIHGYGEVGYGFSQGSIPDGTLSLSQFQFTAGLHIRLNPF